MLVICLHVLMSCLVFRTDLDEMEIQSCFRVILLRHVTGVGERTYYIHFGETTW